MVPLEGPFSRRRPPTDPLLVFLILLACSGILWLFWR